jgi:hypothetical protein
MGRMQERAMPRLTPPPPGHLGCVFCALVDAPAAVPTVAPAVVSAASLALALLLSGCTGYQPPKAADRRALARPDMRMGADALDDRLHQKVYSSNETAAGRVD